MGILSQTLLISPLSSVDWKIPLILLQVDLSDDDHIILSTLIQIIQPSEDDMEM
jgi:hypothetical protein